MIARFFRKPIKAPKSPGAANGFSNSSVTGEGTATGRPPPRPPASPRPAHPAHQFEHSGCHRERERDRQPGLGDVGQHVVRSRELVSAGDHEDRGQHDPRGKIAVTPSWVRPGGVVCGHRSSFSPSVRFGTARRRGRTRSDRPTDVVGQTGRVGAKRTAEGAEPVKVPRLGTGPSRISGTATHSTRRTGPQLGDTLPERLDLSPQLGGTLLRWTASHRNAHAPRQCCSDIVRALGNQYPPLAYRQRVSTGRIISSCRLPTMSD